MATQRPRPEKRLLIWDLDNTLTDTLKFWGTATLPAVRLLATEFSIDEETLAAAIHRAPAQYRFCDFGSMVHWLDDQKILPSPAAGAEHYAKEVTKQAVRHLWYRKQKEMTVFYPGALETLRGVKAKGASNVIYTDTEASSLIRRFWLLAYNARRQGFVKDEHAVLDLIDHFYCMPSIEDDQAILRDCDLVFALRMKQNMTIWRDDIRKPCLDHTAIILSDFSTAAKNALFIGDTAKDGGSARPLKMDFAWVRFGAEAEAETVKIAQRLSSPDYKYGIEAIRASFSKSSRPTRVLRRGLPELLEKFSFAPGNPFSGPDHTDRTESAYPRSTGGQAGKVPAAHRLAPLFHAQPRTSPLGPATHLEPEPPAPEPQGSADRADQKRPTTPGQSPQP